MEEVTVDEITALRQREIIKNKCKEAGKGKTEFQNVYGIIRRAFEAVHGYELPNKYDESIIIWSTGANMEL
ncbi:MAG: hypothetical protein ACRCST_04255, partial [Turicibacter sp.]